VRNFLIGLAAFLTLVDLFATQAILPALAQAYGVRPAAMGLAVNAATLGMALGALAVAFFSRHIDRRAGIAVALGLLALPTALLAAAPDLASFAALRIAQGLCMAIAFALTLSYLAEHCSAADSAGAFAAYIAGNVASNLVGRLMAASLVDHLGIAANFLAFSALNLGGAALVWFWLGRAAPAPMGGARSAFWAAIAVAIAGLPLLVLPSVPAVLAGLVLVGAGTFFAQATTTGFVGRAASTDRGSASGLYLACYFAGGLAGTAVLGLLFERLGWAACVAGIGVALVLAAALAARLTASTPLPAA